MAVAVAPAAAVAGAGAIPSTLRFIQLLTGEDEPRMHTAILETCNEVLGWDLDKGDVEVRGQATARQAERSGRDRALRPPRCTPCVAACSGDLLRAPNAVCVWDTGDCPSSDE